MMSEKNLIENLGFKEYRQNPAISNSDLKYLHCPPLFKMNKEQQLQGESQSYQNFGSLLDSYLLKSRERFGKEYMEMPDIETPSSPNQKRFLELVLNHQGDLSTKDIGDYYKQCYKLSNPQIEKEVHISEGIKLKESLQDYIDLQQLLKIKKTYTPDEMNSVRQIETNMQYNKAAEFLLWNQDFGIIRKTHLKMVDYKLFGVTWKGEADLVVIDTINKIIYNVDLKTTSKTIEGFKWQYKNYHYHRQQALYRELIKLHLVAIGIIENASEYIIKTRCLVAQSIGINEVAVIPIPEPVLHLGLEEIREAAELIQYYEKNGWQRTRSYNTNEGLEVINWDEVFS